MNKFIGIGRLTRDVELRKTRNDKSVGNFTLAINRKFKNENGDYEADFFNCVVWGAGAETLAKYTKKGDLIGVEGRLQNRTYEVEGIKKYATDVIVESYDFLSTKKETTQEPEKDVYEEYDKMQDPFDDVDINSFLD